MSLSSALVDRARVLRREVVTSGAQGVPVKVEGSTVYEDAPGQWFSCRVDAPAAPKQRDAAGGRSRPDRRPMLIYELEDDDGNPVDLHADDRVEVDSEELGLSTWELVGEPQIDRKKVDLVAGEASISRVLDERPTGMPYRGRQVISVSPSGSGSVS